jgi:hypothetical protein
MPPKQRGKSDRLPAGDRAEAANQVAQWLYRSDPKPLMVTWSPYNEVDNTAIEGAYRAKTKSVPISGGYVVDLTKMVQFKADGTAQRRPIKREVVASTMTPAVSSAEGEASPVAKEHRAESELTRKLSAASTAAERSSGDEHANTPGSIQQRSTVDESAGVASSSWGGAPFAPASPAKPASAPTSVDLTRPTGGQVAVIGEGLLHHEVAPAPPSPRPRAGIVKSGSNVGNRGDNDAPSSTAKMPPRSVAAIISRVVAECPGINRTPLTTAAAKMHPSTRQWMIELGRPASQKNMAITLAVALDQQPDKKKMIKVSSSAQLLKADLQLQAKGASLTYFGGPLPDPLLVPAGTSLTQNRYRDARRVMISGPVSLLYDNDYDAIAKPPTIVVCSTPGINFAYSKEDVADFTEADEDGGPRMIDHEKAIAHMTKVWAHVLVVMDEFYRVQFPVLCAIGCGAFRGKFGNMVPRLWATALHRVLSTRRFHHIHAVFLSAPTFGDTSNYAPFVHTLRNLSEGSDKSIPLKVPVVVTEDMSMVTIASQLADWGFAAGILNPSDVEAMRRGWIGMYWDGGHIAVEEILAMQTSMLVHHVGVNPDLYGDPARRLAVDV